VVEARAFGQAVEHIPAEGDGPAQGRRLLEHRLAHALELQPREVPDGRGFARGQVLVQGAPLAHLEAVPAHLADVLGRHSQVGRRHQVDDGLLEDP